MQTQIETGRTSQLFGQIESGIPERVALTEIIGTFARKSFDWISNKYDLAKTNLPTHIAVGSLALGGAMYEANSANASPIIDAKSSQKAEFSQADPDYAGPSAKECSVQIRRSAQSITSKLRWVPGSHYRRMQFTEKVSKISSECENVVDQQVFAYGAAHIRISEGYSPWLVVTNTKKLKVFAKKENSLIYKGSAAITRKNLCVPGPKEVPTRHGVIVKVLDKVSGKEISAFSFGTQPGIPRGKSC
jgi:hypothetical protein